MNSAEWAAASAARFHVIFGRDELGAGSNDLATAKAVAANLTAGRKSAGQVVDTAGRGYIRFFAGREVEVVGEVAA